MSVISAPRLRLPDQVNIDFGPAEILGPAFLHLDRSARERGIYLSISRDFGELAEVNRRNREDWYPLVPMFDSSIGGVSSENGFWIYGVNDRGAIVATQAARLYLWPDTTFVQEWEDRTFIYEDPARQSQPDERCTANCPGAYNLTGRVCHTGALWMHPDYRNTGIGSLLPRVTRAYALTTWYPDFMFGIAKIRASLNAQSVKRLYGWQHYDRELNWYGSPHLGDITEIAVCWMNEQEVLADVGKFSAAQTQNSEKLAA